jgi:hypothetical protein
VAVLCCLVHALPSGEARMVLSKALVTGIGSSANTSETVALPARVVTGLPEGW